MTNPLNSLLSTSPSYIEYPKYQATNTSNEILISRVEPTSKKKTAKPDIIRFSLELDSGIPLKSQKTIEDIISGSLVIILANLPSDMKNLLSLSDKKITPEHNEIIIKVGTLKDDLEKYFKKNINDLKFSPNAHIDSITVLAKKNSSDKKGLVIILLDYNLLRQKMFKYKDWTWLVTLNHEICGHLPLLLEDKVPKNKNEHEYKAYNISNRVLANIIKSFKEKRKNLPKNSDRWQTLSNGITQLEKLLEKEKQMEIYYKNRLKK